MKKFTDLNIPRKVTKQRYIVNAEGKILGRLAQEIAKTLRGKGNPIFSYHRDLGDQVVVFNAEKIKVTGEKLSAKRYTAYSGYPGGLKQVTLERLLREHPERVIEHAVRGMLPKTPLGRKLFGNLKVYRGQNFPFKTKETETVKVSS